MTELRNDPSGGSRSRLTLTLDPAHLEYVWGALETLGLGVEKVQSPVTWTFVRQSSRTWPVAFTSKIVDEHGVSVDVELRCVGQPRKPLVVCDVLELALVFDDENIDAARSAMARFHSEYDVAVRETCLGADHFLGKALDASAWHQRSWPPYLLVAVNHELERVLEDWRIVGTGPPRGGRGPCRSQFRGPDGPKVEVYTEVRYFARRGDCWMVVDLTANEGGVSISAAAVGVDEWPEKLLQDVEPAIENYAAFSQGRMTPAGEELELEREYSWSDLFVDPGLKQELRSEIEDFFERKDIYEKLGLCHRRGLLVHGAPGTGKTLFGKILACTVSDCTFVWITARDVGSADHVARIFRMARSCERAILFFEDLDFYAARRELGPSWHTGPLGQLLVELDGMRANEGMLVVATTNDLEAIEPALRDRPSRFDRTIEFLPAPREVRAAHLMALLDSFGVARDVVEAVAAEANGLTGAQIQELALASRRRAASASGEIDLEALRAGLDDARRFKSTVAGFGAAREADDDDFEGLNCFNP